MNNFIQIQTIVKKCLKNFQSEDIFLLENDVDERTISNRLAFYLQSEIPKFKVDCEYNRKEYEIKKIIAYKGSLPRKIYPDIIVHERGTNSNNLLVIEIKKQGNLEIENDEIKLKALTSEQYRYDFGLLIIFYTMKESKNKPILRWFSKGKELSQI